MGSNGLGHSNYFHAYTYTMRVLITGVTGQDGSYLAEKLLSEGHKVYGLLRRTSLFNTQRIDHIFKDSHLDSLGLEVVHGDMSDASSIQRAISQVAPDQIYNLAAQSHVAVSFEEPEYTADAVGLGTLRVLEAIRNLHAEGDIRFYQASTSELFGGQTSGALNESSPFNPRSPYAAAKMYAHTLTTNYKEAFGFFACNGILFNHESPRRGPTFVTRKITLGISRIISGSPMPIYLGNLDAVRDWGHAKDYVNAMTLILNAKKPSDYVVATGIGHTVRDFLRTSCEIANLKVEFVGSGPNEKLINVKTGQVVAQVDVRYHRPLEVNHLIGDPRKIQQELGWKPEITFQELVEEMVLHDLRGIKP
jgi:GDPmannose 4,6-dehydratase